MLDRAGAHRNDAVAAGGERRVVGDERQRRAAPGGQREDQLHDRASGRLVEIAGRLVGDQRATDVGTSARASATRCCSPPESWAG